MTLYLLSPCPSSSFIYPGFHWRMFWMSLISTQTSRSSRGWRRSSSPTRPRSRTSWRPRGRLCPRFVTLSSSSIVSFLFIQNQLKQFYIVYNFRTFSMTSQSTGWRVPRTGPSLWTPWTRVRGQTRALWPGPRGRPTSGSSIVMVTEAPGYPPPPTTGANTMPKLNNTM